MYIGDSRVRGAVGEIEYVDGGYAALTEDIHESGEEEGATSVSGTGLYEKVWLDVEDDLLIHPHIERTFLGRDAHPGGSEPGFRRVVVQPVELTDD